MPIPHPEPGLVISYAYLWRHEHAAGKEEGRKIRPCVIILAAEKQEGRVLVTVAPLTHSSPEGDEGGMEIPPAVKKHLGLDGEKSWVVLEEVNQFVWPGYDIYPVSGTERYAYGFLPPRLFNAVKAGVLDLILKHRSVVRRD